MKRDILLQIFVDSLIDDMQNKEGNWPKRQKANNNKKTTHNKRKKSLYAKHQKLYKKCPRKLLDLALSGEPSNGKQAISDLSGTGSVDLLYKNLWGQVGPEKYMTIQPLNNKIEMSEIWTSIIMGNLIEKFKKIKANTAAMDRIKKLHQKKKGELHVFTKLCNLFMLHRIYPA